MKSHFKLEGDENDTTFQVKKRFLHADLSHAIDPFSGEAVDLKSQIDTAFLSSGRLFYHQRILLWFPKYFSLYNKSFMTLFQKEKSLSMKEKYYIAIMAASSFECESMLNIL